MKDSALDVDKIHYRLDFFKDAYKTLLIVSGGSIIVIVTFFQRMNGDISKKNYLIFGISCLVFAMLSQLLIPLLNIISSGLYWDALNHESEPDYKLSQSFGRTSGSLLIIGTIFAMVGLTALAIFAMSNIH